MKYLLPLTLALSSIGYATEPGKKPNTPKQPWSDYVVHDGTRPTPEKVKTHGAVTTPAPADAKILFDGKDTSAFTKEWKVKDGILIASWIIFRKLLDSIAPRCRLA